MDYGKAVTRRVAFRHCNRTAFTSPNIAQWFAYFMRQKLLEYWAESERCQDCGYWHVRRVADRQMRGAA